MADDLVQRLRNEAAFRHNAPFYRVLFETAADRIEQLEAQLLASEGVLVDAPAELVKAHERIKELEAALVRTYAVLRNHGYRDAVAEAALAQHFDMEMKQSMGLPVEVPDPRDVVVTAARALCALWDDCNVPLLWHETRQLVATVRALGAQDGRKL